jgi:hypothetical protein
MNELTISMSSEIKPLDQLEVSVKQRQIQVLGSLLEYNPLEDCDIPRVNNCFLCLDQIAGKSFAYMLNVVDQS